MNKKLIFSFLALLVVVFGFYVFKNKTTVKNTDNNVMVETPQVTSIPTQTQPQPTVTSKQDPAKTTGISTAELSSHDNSSDCWMAIEGKVYNVTSFITSHPGGMLITMGCGKDATSLFRHIPGRGTHSKKSRKVIS